MKKFSLKKLPIQELLLDIPHTQGIWSRIGGVRMTVLGIVGKIIGVCVSFSNI